MTENPDVTVERLEELVDAFNRKDLDKIVEAFTEDGEFLLAAGPDAWGCRFTGREAIREALAQRFAAVPDIRWSDGRHWISGQQGAVGVAGAGHPARRRAPRLPGL